MFVRVDEKDNFASLNDQISVVHLYADSEREDILKAKWNITSWTMCFVAAHSNKNNALMITCKFLFSEIS